MKTGPARPSPWADARNWQDFGLPLEPAASKETKASPDGKWEAFIRNYNLYVRPKEDKKPERPQGGRLCPPPPPGGGRPAPEKRKSPSARTESKGIITATVAIAWSPGFEKNRRLPGPPGYPPENPATSNPRPPDQLQPKYSSIGYTKPGDVIDFYQPVLFLVDEPQSRSSRQRSLRQSVRALRIPTGGRTAGPSPSSTTSGATRFTGSSRWTPRPAKPRAVISEEPKTFFYYSGKKYRSDVADGKEIVWMSERDGWNHLYLYDGATGAVKNQITKGEWVVRGVDKVDEETRKIWFQASGHESRPGPLFRSLLRDQFRRNGPDRADRRRTRPIPPLSPPTWPVLRRLVLAATIYPPSWTCAGPPTASVVLQAERTDISALVKAGWKAPEVFTAKARDGKTDIWGVIFRPAELQSEEKISGHRKHLRRPARLVRPQGIQSVTADMQALAELGFIVVQVDGMGTSNRSKAFHDVCWKNIGDAGFPDRILWHKAIAAKYPYYDITRVGIYGTSAGGQNALGALLFHPEFYKAGFSACGCHDNRMDKIWWNEQWMGWPLGPEYAASSNVDNAYRLEGKLLLLVGEMDTNVDPSSTMQVVNALIKANKTFELIVVPGADHTSGGAFGERKRNDFFVRHLLGVEPPDWNKPEPPPAPPKK